ncbi:MAG: ABC transporter ATP-binding protein [Chrysiogenetes bacterium]|nr:ABC transporter ATP-binding protein [Chrysiogenetes bacterium]
MSEESQFYAEDLVRFGSADAQMLRRLLVFLKPYWKMVVVATVLLLANTGLVLAIPMVLRNFVDNVLTPMDGERLYRYGLIIFVLVTAYATVSATQGYLFTWIGQRVMFDIRRDLFAHVQRLPIRYYDKNPVGRLVTRVTNDIASLNELFAGGFVQLINDTFLIGGIIVAMFVLDSHLAAWVCLVFPPLFFLIGMVSRWIRVVLREAKRLIARINAFLNENITGMAVTQLFSREADRNAEFRAVVDQYTDTQVSLIRTQSYFLPISTSFAGLMGAAILWIGGQSALAGITTVGTITAFLYYAQQIYFPIRTFTDKFNILLLAMASAERIFTLMDERPELNDDELLAGHDKDLLQHKPLGGSITFDHVSFGYNVDAQALKDVSFDIEPGQSVAVVGATGSGKTTLINLLVRYYPLEEGRILLDGNPINELPAQEIRRCVGVVPQDVFLFSGSVLDNLFMPESMSEEERRANARRIFEELGCEEFLDKLPQGLDTPITERGGNLSAGERQLIAFARLLCYDPEVVVLDEATANIDASTERLIQRATARLIRGRTSIIIAHRLSTILGVNRIMVLHHGHLIEQGNHESLLAEGGVYAKLYELQFSGQNGNGASATPA